MSDRGSGLTIIAIIIAVGAVGMGGYTIFIQPATIIDQASGSSEITHIWTKVQSGNYYTTGSYADVTDMDLSITVAAGETVYVMFNALFSNGASGGGTGFLTCGVRVMIDTTGSFVEIPGSERFFAYEVDYGIAMGSDITTQFIIEDLAAGTYELKLQATGDTEVGTDRLSDGLLMVYTYR